MVEQPSDSGGGADLGDTRDYVPLPAGPAPAPSQPARPVRQKTSTLGDFRLVAVLGEGGMGTVYKARQISRPRDVALKVLAKGLAEQPGLVERFHREGRLLARLEHPHIIRCYAVGEALGFHYLAMEFAGGGGLQVWLRRLGRLVVGDALHVGLACARALQYAHAQGLVHRDVKPANILLTGEGVVKVADLGLAKAVGDLGLTQTGMGLGTPLYAAPEQALDAKRVDARSDLYALGCVLYHLLTGQPPFTGSNLVEVIGAKEKGAFAPARRLNPEVPGALDRIFPRLLARQPELRYRSCAELVEDLRCLGRDHTELSFLAPAAGRA
jgi:serine/threonine-protein kinase